MLPNNLWNQYGQEGLDPIGIIIHNTGSSLSATEIFEWLKNECLTSQGCHFLIDNENIVQVMPLNWKTWTTGKGNDWAFDNCIAVEICDCDSKEKQDIAQEKAIAFIKELMEQYNISKNQLYFHIEFNERTYCPHILLDQYSTKKNFVERNFE